MTIEGVLRATSAAQVATRIPGICLNRLRVGCVASLAEYGVYCIVRFPGLAATCTVTSARSRAAASGEALQAMLAPIGEGMQDIERKLAGQDAALQGTIRVTTTDTLIAVLLPVLADFRVRYPGIQLQITVNNSFLNLSKRDADVAIRPSNTPPDSLVGRKAGTLRTAPYASSAYLALRAQGDHEWIAPDDSLAHLRQARWLREHVPAGKVAASVDSLLGMAAAVEAGLGAGMLLCLLADARPGLVRLADPDPALDTDVWILTHPDLRRVQRIRVFTAFVFDGLQAALGPA